ncbi:hypothetical protein ACFY1L_10100 [Streptomyces sp. NPDC001663]|uniref:hypothetical protein n=1 Tax=Streptomyces sp. NPDC001663 TaxID=3364597 RepID=UPI0036C9A5D6
MTINADVMVPVTRAHPAAPTAAAAQQDETSAIDLVLPLLAVGVVGVLAGYGYVRRTRRARTRTTPGGAAAIGAAVPPLSELDERARALLVEADDCVRTSRDELGFARARFGAEAVAPFAQAVRDAESELAAAFRMRQQYDDGVPDDETSRRHALTGIVGRCQEAGRRLDAEAGGFDRLRALGPGGGLEEALQLAEVRFRELTARTGSAEATVAELGRRYSPAAIDAVTGHTEQAKDRLVFATTRLNRSRQAADSEDGEGAIRHLRAAEGATAQASVFVTGIERLAADLASAAGLLPAALTGAEAELAAAKTGGADLPAGELHARAAHADLALAAVREELTAGPHDPLDALRRIVHATAPVAVGRAGVLSVASPLVARSALDAAEGFVATHRGAVGSAARTRLAEAQRLLGAEPPDALAADVSARQARALAEQDVRVHGNPITGTAEHASGVAGVVLGGVLLGGAPDGGPPASYGGPHTRARRGAEASL